MEAEPGEAIVATRLEDILVLTVPSDLGEQRLQALEARTLECVHQTPVRGVILELGGLQFMDAPEFTGLKALANAVKYLGVETVFVGLRPGIIAYLAQADADLTGISAAFGLDDALARFDRR